MEVSATLRQEKLALLMDEYEMSEHELMIEYGLEEVVPGICMNEGCEYTAEYEPDGRNGWCDECGTQTVASFLVLLEMI